MEINVLSYHWSIIPCGVLHGSLIGPLLFLIYIHDQPQSLRQQNFFSLDFEVTALGQADILINQKMCKLKYRLNAIKVIINMDKTVQTNVQSSSSMNFQLNK